MKHARILFALAAAATLVACGDDKDDTTNTGPTQDIVQLAQGNPDLSILVEAVGAAELAATLQGAGPYTVFAPTNAAFASLLTELNVSKAELLANKPLLTAVLKYHVLTSKVAKADIPLGKAITPFGGGFFKIETSGADVIIQDGRNRTAKITATDIAAKNGLVHVIDRVILPADKDIVDTALALPDFSILAEAVQAADLVTTLKGAGPFTVFAPTNEAFANLLGELNVTKAQLLANKALLTEVLTYHVLAARVLEADVTPGAQPNTVQGENFSISSGFVVTDKRARTANITATDVFTSNGVIHVLDKVILPSP
ncbi:MAG: fasciclin domain-containing protein [Anaeromyxobacter sp.]